MLGLIIWPLTIVPGSRPDTIQSLIKLLNSFLLYEYYLRLDGDGYFVSKEKGDQWVKEHEKLK